MKHIFKITGSICTAAIIAAGCTKKIDEAYANPNADVRVPVEQLLPNMIATMATNGAGHGPQNDIRFIGKYIQNFVFYASGGRYDQMGGTTGTSDNAASIWRTHFYDLGQNVLKMIEWASEEKKWDYAGVGKSILAWSWLTLSDYHGEVISVNEAFNTSALTFSYGTQEEVYNHVKQLCYEALELLNKTGDGANQANLAKGDAYFYNGDVEKWKKFTNGVMARLYNHLSNKSIYNADSVVYYCNRSILTNADNGLVKFANTGVSGTANFFGPLRNNLSSTVIGTETAIRQSSFIANLLSGKNNAFLNAADPRAWYLIRPNTNNTFVGLDPNKGQTVIAANDRPESFFGASQAGGANNVAPANDNNCRYIFKNASPFPIMTAAEIQFIKAEALLRKGDRTGALAAYKEGISQNFDMLTSVYQTSVPADKFITSTMKNDFLNNTTVVPAAATDLTLTKIMLQKYIALYIHGACETWTDMRRFHYTDTDPATGQQVYRDFAPPSGTDLNPDNGGQLVYRVRPRYNSEYVWNLKELERIGATAANYHTKKCWFSEP
ncbi:MAG: SusD/RagB family nutrient-binding outer membrane lipoprotein [Citrobacter freundii]|nr:MAG: SusD/RagB family nutrient-binding outer membrane lipoprotein [Citrobacter freundii]